MKRFFATLTALAALFSVSAQSPEAIREMIRENSNFSIPTVTTYQNVPIGKIAPAPKGYKLFYYSLTGRHGSRYELVDTTFVYTCNIFNRAAKLGILNHIFVDLLSDSGIVPDGIQNDDAYFHNLFT